MEHLPEEFEITDAYRASVENVLREMFPGITPEEDPFVENPRKHLWGAGDYKLLARAAFNAGGTLDCMIERMNFTPEGWIQHRTYDWTDQSLQVVTTHFSQAEKAKRLMQPPDNAADRERADTLYNGFSQGDFPPTTEEYLDFLDDLCSHKNPTE